MSSVISSSSDHFSVRPIDDYGVRSPRSVASTYDHLEATSTSASAFSDLGAVSPRSRTPSGSQILSISGGERSDEEEEFIFVPQSPVQTRFRQTFTVQTPSRRAIPFEEDSDGDDEDEEILVLRSPPVTAHSASPLNLRQMVRPPASDSESDAEEDRAREIQRTIREQDDEKDDAHDEDQEDIIFRGQMQHLSISPSIPQQTPAASVLPLVVQSVVLNNAAGARDTPTPTRHHFTVPVPAVEARSNAQPAPPPVLQQIQMPVIDIGVSQSIPAQTKTAKRRHQRIRAKAKAKLRKLQAGGNNSDDTSSSSTEAENPAKGDVLSLRMYADAIRYVTSYLKNPPANPPADVRLHFFQSLIIELGLLHKPGTELPTSCTAAKALIKSRVHINAREYVQHRSELASNLPSLLLSNAPTKKKAVINKQTKELSSWLDEMQQLMFPSRAALARSIHARRGAKNGTKVKPASTKWIKNHGLDIFLVNVYP